MHVWHLVVYGLCLTGKGRIICDFSRECFLYSISSFVLEVAKDYTVRTHETKQ